MSDDVQPTPDDLAATASMPILGVDPDGEPADLPDQDPQPDTDDDQEVGRQ